MSECRREGCTRPSRTRGLCYRDYRAWRRDNPELVGKFSLAGEQESVEWFWRRIEVRGLHECWPWLGPPDDGGYGTCTFMGRRREPHQVAWELALKQPFPEGFTADHICHNKDLSCPGGPSCPHRRCCNPAHIKPRTNAHNTMAARRLERRRARNGGDSQ